MALRAPRWSSRTSFKPFHGLANRNDEMRPLSVAVMEGSRLGQQMSAESTTVFFTSGGVTCAADLYQSDGASEPTACLVLGHGFSGTKGLARVYAEQFAAAGLAVLVFDYRHFGASGGEPRQIVDVGKQRADYHAAVHYARTLPRVDPARIAVWGTSFSGG